MLIVKTRGLLQSAEFNQPRITPNNCVRFALLCVTQARKTQMLWECGHTGHLLGKRKRVCVCVHVLMWDYACLINVYCVFM